VEECTTHLRLLETFVIQKQKVQEWAEVQEVSPTSAWNSYLQLAAKRFAQWVSAVELAGTLPPLDVLMVWHSFMLNPHKYAEFERLAGLPDSFRLSWSAIVG
jgi:hypothetical protein